MCPSLSAKAKSSWSVRLSGKPDVIVKVMVKAKGYYACIELWGWGHSNIFHIN